MRMEFDKQKELNKLRRSFEETTDFMQAVGDASRQRILIAIMSGEFGGSRVGEISKKAHLSQPAASHHLKILKDAGIVKMYSSGTKNFYYIDASSNEFAKVRQLILSFERVAGEFIKVQNYGEEK